MVSKLTKKLLKIILIITRLALITICLHLVKQMQTSIEILSTLKYLFLKAKTNTSLVFVFALKRGSRNGIRPCLVSHIVIFGHVRVPPIYCCPKECFEFKKVEKHWFRH